MMENMSRFHIRPARPDEAGLFYTPHPEEDKRRGTIGHIRMDFGRSGNEFWHTWWPRGPEELNSPAFKAELQEVVDTMREDVLKSRFAMERFCYDHGGKITGGYVQNYGVSICVAGATSSGKTTVAGWLLSTIPDRKRIFTIEDGSRELQLIREHDGRVTNSVVHTQTRDSENERQRIDQIALLDIALRFNPDIICVGEMRGPEANAAQEAARVGIAVLTTIHSNSSEGTYRRMVSLCKRAVDTPDDTSAWITARSTVWITPSPTRTSMATWMRSISQRR